MAINRLGPRMLSSGFIPFHQVHHDPELNSTQFLFRENASTSIEMTNLLTIQVAPRKAYGRHGKVIYEYRVLHLTSFCKVAVFFVTKWGVPFYLHPTCERHRNLPTELG